MKTLGSRIKYYRRIRNLSQIELSKLAGVSKSYLSEIERGIHENITIIFICNFCIALNITPNDLIPEHYYKGRK